MLVAFCALAEGEILDNSSSAATGAKETRRERAMAARERTTALQSSVTASSVKDLERNDVTTREKRKETKPQVCILPRILQEVEK